MGPGSTSGLKRPKRVLSRSVWKGLAEDHIGPVIKFPESGMEKLFSIKTLFHI